MTVRLSSFIRIGCGLWRALAADRLALVLLVLGGLYVGAAWSPSSYGLVLRDLGARDDGVVLFDPQPIRSDEWAVWTPLTQMSVSNGFRRIDERSLYREDMRNFNALPLLDWALAFRPQYWGYFLTDPAHAFSFSHYLFVAAFLLGYRALFRHLGFSGGLALTGALVLFFNPFTQRWWTTWEANLALFPWILVAALAGGSAVRRGLGVFLATALFLFGHLYPPLILSLAYAGLVLVAALRPDALRPRMLVVAGLGVLAAGMVAALYFAETIPVMAHTVYPGHREIGGGRISLRHFLTQIFPFLNLLGHGVLADGLKLQAPNACEVAVVGSLLPLAALLFTGRGAAPMPPTTRRSLLVLGLGLLPIAAWMMLPLPPWAGRLLLWSTFSPQRLFFAAGLLVTAAALLVLRDRPLRIGPWRLALFAAIGLAAWLWSKAPLGAAGMLAQGAWRDLLPVGAAGALALVWRFGTKAGWGEAPLRQAVLAAVAGVGLLGFGDFNPVMSAYPIFRPSAPGIGGLAARAAQHPDRVLAVEPGRWAAFGAVPGGLGFRAVNHVLTLPRPDLFRPRFPELGEEELQFFFNRYSHIRPRSGLARPELDTADAVLVPVDAFLPARGLRLAETCPEAPAGGSVDRQTVEADGRILLWGWSRWRGPFAGQSAVLGSDRPVRATLRYIFRPDVAKVLGDERLALAGFELWIEPADPTDPPRHLCLATDDAVDGWTRLTLPSP